MRDRTAVAVANWILNTFASREYVAKLNAIINLGFATAARDRNLSTH